MKTPKRSNQARYMEESDFRKGYDAAAIYADFDWSKPEAWQNGWDAYQDDEDACDQKSW